MKMNIKTILAAALCCGLFTVARAQTNNTAGPAQPDLLGSPTIQGGVQQIVDAVGSATNYAVSVYGTYAPDVKNTSKWGGGVLGLYNLNDYVAPAIGVDYLGRFSLISANMTLQVAVYPFRNSRIVLLRQVMVTPLGIIGAGHPMSGANSGLTGIYDVGGQIRFGHFLGGQFGTGVTWGKWTNAGDYSGTRYHAFLDISWGM